MKKFAIAGVVGAVLIIGVILFLFRTDPVEKRFEELKNNPVQAREINMSALADIKYKDLGEGAVGMEDLTFDQMIALLRKKYGEQLKYPYMRIRMLEELLRFLKQKYPDTWVQQLQEILGAAFPDQAKSLFDQSEKLYKYNKYMEENQAKLSKMSEEDRRSKLWDLRHSLFGEDADGIWAGEKATQKVADTLKQIRESKDTSPSDKLKTFQSSLNDAYGKALPNVMENQRQTLTNSFIDAVQNDLAAMKPAERTAFLHDIRAGMGMDDAALNRWDKLETDRDQRWSNGELYMEQRKEITGKYSGDEREKKLDELRKKLFGEEGESIKNEEAGGYFRFSSKRRYGRE